MTRDEFRAIDDWEDLRRFGCDVGCPWADDIYSEDEMDGWLEDSLVGLFRHMSWRELRDYLDDIPVGYDYYVKDDDDRWNEGDEAALDDYKDNIAEWCDDNGVWDDEEEDDCVSEEDCSADENEDDSEPPDDVSVEELFSGCAPEAGKAAAEDEHEKEQAEQALEAFYYGG